VPATREAVCLELAGMPVNQHQQHELLRHLVRCSTPNTLTKYHYKATLPFCNTAACDATKALHSDKGPSATCEAVCIEVAGMPVNQHQTKGCRSILNPVVVETV
jgi:hypothetical protein